MTTVAVRLVARSSAAAEPGLGDAIDGPSRAGDQFYGAFELQGPVHSGGDRHRSIAGCERLGFVGRGVPGGLEFDTRMTTVAPRLVLRSPATAQRRTQRRRLI